MIRPRFLAATLILAFALIVLGVMSRKPDEMLTGGAHAIDGDSLVVNSREIRLNGLDAPELRQTCEEGGQQVACGRRALAALKRAITRGPVTCLGNEIDRYGRLLATCRVNGQDVGAELVRNGLAVDYGGYPGEEAEAKRLYRGLWAGSFERPEAWRRRHRDNGDRARP